MAFGMLLAGIGPVTLWVIVMVLLQVTNVVRHHVPLQERGWFLPKAATHLGKLFLDAEEAWHKVATNSWDASRTHKEVMNLKRRNEELQEQWLTVALPRRDDFMKEAENLALRYFRNNYRVEKD